MKEWENQSNDLFLTATKRVVMNEAREDANDQARKLVNALAEYEICDPITHAVEGYWIDIQTMNEIRRELGLEAE